MSSAEVNLKKFLIPLEEFKRASENFKRLYDSNSFYKIYKGQLSEDWHNRTSLIAFSDEHHDPREKLEIVSRFHHKNIIPFIGYCEYEGNRMLFAYEYPTNGSLHSYFISDENVRLLTWAKRLKICIGLAKGLNYLHSGGVIHGDLRDKHIFLDENLEPSIGGFHISVLVHGNQPHPQIYKPAPQRYYRGYDMYYLDPIYQGSSIFNTESDVYSYGIIMFQMLTVKDFGPYHCHTQVNWVRNCSDEKRWELIDHRIRDHIDRRSFNMFTDIAYKCISFNIKDRPTLDEIVEMLEEALDIHNHSTAASTFGKRGLQPVTEFHIPSEEIDKAKQYSIKQYWENDKWVFIGKLSDRWQNRTAAIKQFFDGFDEDLVLISSFHHENIVPLIGYNDDEKCIVTEYAVNGSLYNLLKDPNKSHCITWAQRIKICVGAAKGLKYLHSGLGSNERVIHGDFRSKKILLYDNLEPKICDFRSAFSGPKDHDVEIEYIVGNTHYMDPIYRESHIPRAESDVYSFGVVLFEVLTGMLADERKSIGDDVSLNLISLIQHYSDDRLDMLIDPHIRDEIDARSFHTFQQLAYKCISFNIKDRPSMNKIVKRLEEALFIQNHGAASTITRKDQKLEDFRIPLKDINLAIGVKGQETRIGDGGFGFVYKGQLSERWQNRTVAIKCLRPDSYQGEYEFRNELNSIFSFSHENIIPFIGYCDEGEEKIIVYEYASNGSLDCRLKDMDKRRFLTWEHRLKICLGAARGLDYLHSGLGEDNRVIHRDVKSANILLDHNLVAKVCDFGLSKSSRTNQPHTQVYTNAAGTNFYMDPVYHESGVLRKESDVYSFGVVMFELLSGMLAYNRRRLGEAKPKPLINLVRRYYDYKPDLLIDPLIRDEIDGSSFNTFREVAFQCISFNSMERPTMEMIVDRVEEALELQVTNQGDLKQRVTKS